MHSLHYFLVLTAIFGGFPTSHWTHFIAEGATEIPANNGSNLNSSKDIQESSDLVSDSSDYFDKDERFMACKKYGLDPDEYTMFENGTVETYNRTYNSSFYLFYGDSLFVCVPQIIDESNSTIYIDADDRYFKFPKAFTYLTIIGLSVSILCLLLHTSVFCLVPDLRNLPGYYTASLSSSLLLGYSCFMISFAPFVLKYAVPCIFFAVVTQFFFLSSFMWSSAIAFDVFRALWKATGKLRLSTTKFSLKKYAMYCLYAWGTPVIFVAVTLVLDNVEGVPEDYMPKIGDEICWIGQRNALLILFVAPISTVILTNILFFAMSAYIIYSNRMKSTEAAHREILERNFVVYFRLSVVMGLTWTVGVVAGIVETMWVWYVFVILNTLQGFFIFVAFTCSKKVSKSLKHRFSSRIRKMSSQSSAPTFQSYCNVAFSGDCDAKPDYGKSLDGSPLTMKKIDESDELASNGIPENTNSV